MRVRKKNSGIVVHAVAGTNVVLMGFDVTEAKRKGLLGFSIERTDHTENEQYWLKTFRPFEEVEPNPAPGQLVSSAEHPVQAFKWSDFTAKPGHKYTYKVVPRYGKPKKLTDGPTVEVTINTENEDDGKHAIFFNRGVAGSQAYAREFQNQPPDKVADHKAFIWLSRGLEEALLGFIGQAKDPSFGLRAAVYEFNYLPVHKAFGATAKKCKDVKIIYDAKKLPKKDKDGKTIKDANGKPILEDPKSVRDAKAAIKEAGIEGLVIKRTNAGDIAHNKFIVLLKNDKPVAVWTGSTNITEGGIFGQSNVGHIVRDPDVAQAYFDYWTRLSENPEVDDLRAANAKLLPDPTGKPPANTVLPIFSPRPNAKKTVLDWYAENMSKAKKTVCFTAAFGVSQTFADVFAEDKDYLRFILLEKPGTTFKQLQQDRDNLIAIGAFIQKDDTQQPQRWLQEKLSGLNPMVRFLHTKYMLIDPLTDDPIVLSGSANFSPNSTTNNDENMLVIRGDQRVADIYLGEFMRIFEHFQTRDVINKLSAKPGSAERIAAFLVTDDSWTAPYFKAGSIKEKERILLS